MFSVAREGVEVSRHGSDIVRYKYTLLPGC
jgi:hypothetical protein